MAKPICWGESGRLNAASSDISGTSVEYQAVESTNNDDNMLNYLIGERILEIHRDIASPGKALRYSFELSLDGSSPDRYFGNIDNGNARYLSGIADNFLHLIVEGAVVPRNFNVTALRLVCNGNILIVRLGRIAVGKISLLALTRYLTSHASNDCLCHDFLSGGQLLRSTGSAP